MPEKPLPFVVNDRRKFTPEGELRPDAAPSPEREARESQPETDAAASAGPGAVPASGAAAAATSGPAASLTEAADDGADDIAADDAGLPPAPTAEQMEQARAAFTATADRLDLAIRASNPGMDHPPAMNFDQLVQSVYMQAILMLGGGTQEGQQPQVDILGARQSIDMLAILEQKTSGNLDPAEKRLLESALFELRIAFLEIAQALARSAQARAGQGGPGGPGFGSGSGYGSAGAPGGRPGPSIVR